MKRIVALIILAAAATVWAIGEPKSNKTTIEMLSGAVNASGTVNLFPMHDYSFAKGVVILEASSYTTGGFGNADTAILTIKSEISPSYIQTIATKTAAIPCTLFFAEDRDTFWGYDMYLTWYWADTIGVTVGDTARTLLKTWYVLRE